MPIPTQHPRKIAVAGAGIVGLTCAWYLTTAGHDVRIYDPAPGFGASRAAAGMLAPGGEAWFGEHELLRLGQYSLGLWHSFAHQTGIALHEGGTLLVGWDAQDRADLRRTATLLESLDVELVSGESMPPEPTLHDRLVPTAWLPREAQVDPRLACETLIRLLGHRVIRTDFPPPAPPSFDLVVRCTGPTAHPSLRRVRGEILRLWTDDPPARVIRGQVHGVPVYLVPRPCGEVVLGATSEAHDDGPIPTVGGVWRLLDAARQLVPGLDRAELREVLARDRPVSPDNGPLIGWTSDRELVAAGHGRNGVLLAPATAMAVLDLIDGREPLALFTPFSVTRYSETRK